MMLQHDVSVQQLPSDLALRSALDFIENDMAANFHYLSIRAALRIAEALATNFILVYSLCKFIDSFLWTRLLIVRGP